MLKQSGDNWFSRARYYACPPTFRFPFSLKCPYYSTEAGATLPPLANLLGSAFGTYL